MNKIFFNFTIIFLLLILICPITFSDKTWKILSMGNSNTEGVGNPTTCDNQYTSLFFDRCEGYRNYLKVMLTNAGISSNFVGFRKSGNFSDNEHEGWSGHGIEKMRDRIKDGLLEQTNPDIILLMIGGNDMWIDHKIPISTSQAPYWVGQYRKLVEEIQQRKPNTYLIIAKSATPIVTSAPLEVLREGIEDIVEEKRAQGKKILLIDSKGCAHDGVHMTPSGFRTFAERWFNEIKKVVNGTESFTPVVVDTTSTSTTPTTSVTPASSTSIALPSIYHDPQTCKYYLPQSINDGDISKIPTSISGLRIVDGKKTLTPFKSGHLWGVWLMFHSSDYIELEGNGYVSIRFEDERFHEEWNQGPFTAPTFSGDISYVGEDVSFAKAWTSQWPDGQCIQNKRYCVDGARARDKYYAISGKAKIKMGGGTYNLAVNVISPGCIKNSAFRQTSFSGAYNKTIADKAQNYFSQFAVEVCDGLDNDSDGVVDEGFACIKNSTNCSSTCTIVAQTCTSFTYSNWSECGANGYKTKEIVTRTPTGCTGGTPDELSESCTYVPECNSDNWVPVDGNCQPDGTFTRSWIKDGNCSGGVSQPVSDLWVCDYTAPTCTSFEYNDWNECQSTGIKTRTIKTRYPTNCEGGNPDLTDPCTFIPPACTYEYSDWSECSVYGERVRSATLLNGPCNGLPEKTIEPCSLSCLESDYDYIIEPTPCPINGVQTKRYYKLNNCVGGVVQPEDEIIFCENENVDNNFFNNDLNNPVIDNNYFVDTNVDTNNVEVIEEEEEVIVPVEEIVEPENIVCEGTLCGANCELSKGICCNGVWNKDWNSCEFNYDYEISIVNSLKDDEAIELMRSAFVYGEKGEVKKSNAYKELAVLKSKLYGLNEPVELTEIYERAKLAVENGEYEKAELLIQEVDLASYPKNNLIEQYGLVTVIALTALLIILIKVFGKKLLPNLFKEKIREDDWD